VWWTSPVLAEDAPGPWHSRRQLILAVANKEGGSHVDPKRAPWYGRIASGEAMLMRLTGPDGELLVRHPSLASVRQVAQEVEQALVRRFPELGG